MRVLEAADTCGGVRNAGKLHGALRDWKHEGNTLDSEGKSDSELSKVVSCKYMDYILRVCQAA